jgi:histidine kinase/DNA gyrase B/HSP90-like ATPase
VRRYGHANSPQVLTLKVASTRKAKVKAARNLSQCFVHSIDSPFVSRSPLVFQPRQRILQTQSMGSPHRIRLRLPALRARVAPAGFAQAPGQGAARPSALRKLGKTFRRSAIPGERALRHRWRYCSGRLATRSDVRAVPADGSLEVSVSDTGVGIAPENQDAVFEEFRQVEVSATKQEGTGLGLTPVSEGRRAPRGTDLSQEPGGRWLHVHVHDPGRA